MSGLTLDRIGFGAANLGNLGTAMSHERAWQIVEAAWESGIRYFDTAPHYGLGLSERRLGAFLQTKPRDEFVLSTKVGRLIRPNPRPTEKDTEGFDVDGSLHREWDFSARGIRQSHAESLERLGLDRIDLLYLHDPERFDLARGISEALPALAGLRDDGVIEAIGVGSMTISALLAAAETGLPDFVMVAGRYTLADQSAGRQVIPQCAGRGIGLVAASVFNSGLLATDEPSEASYYDYDRVPAELLARVRRIRDVCREFDADLPTAAMQFPGRSSATVSTVTAGSRPEQVLQNVQRMSRALPEALWLRLVAEGLIATGDA